MLTKKVEIIYLLIIKPEKSKYFLDRNLFLQTNSEPTSEIDLTVQLDAFAQFVPKTPDKQSSVIKEADLNGNILEVNLQKVKFLSCMQQLSKTVINFCEGIPEFHKLTKHDRICLIEGAMAELLHIRVSFYQF